MGEAVRFRRRRVNVVRRGGVLRLAKCGERGKSGAASRCATFAEPPWIANVRTRVPRRELRRSRTAGLARVSSGYLIAASPRLRFVIIEGGGEAPKRADLCFTWELLASLAASIARLSRFLLGSFPPA